MGVLRLPRIYVKGEVSFDPGLGNNFTEVYDANTVSLSNVPPGMSLAEYRKQLPTMLRGSWNHFGTHRAVFESIKVSGTALVPGGLAATDGLVNKSVTLNGKLVDINPISDNGTQVFFDQMVIGNIAGGIRAGRRKRLHARFLNFTRNIGALPSGWSRAYLASAVWEVCFAKADVNLLNTSTSAVLQQFAASFLLPDVLGLAFRFHTYRTQYYQNGLKNSTPEQPRNCTELEAHYANDRNFSNPVYSQLVGVISPWHSGEFEGHPSGRLIFPSAGIPAIGNRGLGMTFVEVDGVAPRMTIDLGETVPEIDADLNKANVGDVSIVLDHAGQQSILATITPNEYAKSAYEATAGLIDIDLASVPISSDALAEGNLLVKVGGQVVATEIEYVVVAEDRDVYLDEGEPRTLALRVIRRGKPAKEDTSVQVREYDADGLLVGPVATLPVGADGLAHFTVAAAASPGFKTFVFVAHADTDPIPTPAPRFAPNRDFHVNVRFLPFDNALAASTPDSQLTWSWVYENILAVYDVINPVMSRQTNPAINRPLHDRNVMEAFPERIKNLIDKARIEDAAYMPVTRDLSNGKRQLLRRWCDLVINGTAPPEPVPPSTLVVTTKDRRVLSAEGEGV